MNKLQENYKRFFKEDLSRRTLKEVGAAPWKNRSDHLTVDNIEELYELVFNDALDPGFEIGVVIEPDFDEYSCLVQDVKWVIHESGGIIWVDIRITLDTELGMVEFWYYQKKAQATFNGKNVTEVLFYD